MEDRPSFRKLREVLTEMNSDGNTYVNFEALGEVALPPMREDVNGMLKKKSLLLFSYNPS